MKKEFDLHSPSSFEAYVRQIEIFHGYAAPGLLVGGFMVNKAKKLMPPGILYEALCETRKCLPDAVQMLTPCTVGNGRLRIVALGRFALSLFNKDSGVGIRVFPDQAKLESWPELTAWYMKRKSKQEQDVHELLHQIKQAGEEILTHQAIRAKPEIWRKQRSGPVALCPSCGETYPVAAGSLCLACQGEDPYEAK
jgi:formylmethanofuran dehydrogenase subunit E